MSKIEKEDRAQFTRTVTVEYEGKLGPAISERGHEGHATKLRLIYHWNFRTQKWTDDARITWRWLVASGDLGAQDRDLWGTPMWAIALLNEHKPTTVIEIKENN